MFKIFSLITVLLIAFGIGSNDSCNALGISIGAGVIRFKKAIFLFGILVLAGITLNGNTVMETVGKNIVKLPLPVVCLAMSVSAILIILSNWKKLPLSTHQVIIGSLIGAGIAYGATINLFSIQKILLAWLTSPLISGFIGYFFYKFMEKCLTGFAFFKIEKLLRIFLILSASLISFNTGANELATVVGPVAFSSQFSNIFYFYLLGSFSTFLGAFILSHKVIETIGKGIISMDPLSGFSAQFSAGLCVMLFTWLGFPVSTTYCIIGAISGTGLTKGVQTVKISLLKKIILNWFLSFTFSILSSYFLTYLFFNFILTLK